LYFIQSEIKKNNLAWIHTYVKAKRKINFNGQIYFFFFITKANSQGDGTLMLKKITLRPSPMATIKVFLTKNENAI
jgi:hypothetical protein